MIKKTRFLVKEAAGPGSLKPGIAVFIMVIWAVKFPRHMYIQNYFDIWSIYYLTTTGGPWYF